MTINLGNIVSIGGRNVGSGISSGLDVEAIVNQLADAKRIPAVELEGDLEINDQKLTAYSELRTILDALNTAAGFLRDSPGVDNADENIFEYRTTSLTSSTSTAASTYLSATADPGAATGSFEVAVGNLAKERVLRSDPFTSQTSSIVDAAATNAAGRFSAGTFEFAPTAATAVTATTDTSDTLAATDYSVIGAVGTTALATGISNIGVAIDGDLGFIGTISGISGSFTSAPTSELVISFTLNGTTFTSNAIATDGGGSSDSIAASTTITFTDAAGDVSFDVITAASDYLINDDPSNADQFVTDLEADLATQSIPQTRNLSHFIDADVKAPITGLDATEIEFVFDSYDSDGEHGDFGGFTITRNGGNDTDIVVEINGETYQALSLSNTVSSNITLDSTASDNQLLLNIGDAGVTFDFSSQSDADEVEDALDWAFGTRALTDITINEGDSLVDVAAAINSQSNVSGVSAHIIQVADDDFRLSIQATEEGLDNSFVIVDDDLVVHGGVGDGSDGVRLTEEQAAEDAVIAVDDIVITRSTNTIADVISGLNLTLVSETDSFADQTDYDALGSPTLITTDVDYDTETAEAGIINFINAYNDFRVFAEAQTRLNAEGETLNEEAVLQRDTTLSTLILLANAEVNRIVSGVSDSSFSSLGSLGITLSDFEGDDETGETANILTYDTTELQSALANNFTKVREIFEFSFNANSSDISVFGRTNDITLTTFKLDIDTSRTDDEVRVLDASDDSFLFNMDISASGTTFTGQDDTALEGLVLIYSGDGTDTITVNTSQGIGDRFFNLLDPMLEDDGTLDDAVDIINDNTDDLEEEIGRIDEQVERFRDALLLQFSAMEEAITRVNTLLDFLTLNSQSVFGDS